MTTFSSMLQSRVPKGSHPPHLSLSDAIDLVRKIYENGGGQASKDLMSQLVGNSSSSSSFVKKISSLKLYGLVLQQGDNSYMLTDIGTSIAAPVDPEVSADAKKQAFLKIDVFGKVYERHKGKLLPANEFLKNIIEQEFGIPKELSIAWIDAIKSGLRAAELIYDRGDGKLQILESAVVSKTVSVASPLPYAPDAVIQLPKTPPSNESNGIQPTTTVPISGSGHCTKIELSGKRYAVFSIPDTLTKRDAQKLKSALVGVTSIIEGMVSDEENGE